MFLSQQKQIRCHPINLQNVARIALAALTCSLLNNTSVWPADKNTPPTVDTQYRANIKPANDPVSLFLLGQKGGHLPTAEQLPLIQFEGKPTQVHTQGTYISKRYTYITGRLETKPRRAVFIRVSRTAPHDVQWIDLTRQLPHPNKQAPIQLDHPGGFDSDGKSFLIPLSASYRGTGSLILKLPIKEDLPLSQSKSQVVFQDDDHIGAIAYHKPQQHLYGANWDTLHVAIWNKQGKQIARFTNDEWLPDNKGWTLAVQDWKFVGENQLLLSGIDKSNLRPASESKAVIDLIDVTSRKLIQRWRLPTVAGCRHALTREGMAVFQDHLYLLPGDLNDSRDSLLDTAKPTSGTLYRFNWPFATRD